MAIMLDPSSPIWIVSVMPVGCVRSVHPGSIHRCGLDPGESGSYRGGGIPSTQEDRPIHPPRVPIVNEGRERKRKEGETGTASFEKVPPGRKQDKVGDRKLGSIPTEHPCPCTVHRKRNGFDVAGNVGPKHLPCLGQSVGEVGPKKCHADGGILS
eukprot:scaffold1639_cov331-Pavlova_lutheri.AAC.11